MSQGVGKRRLIVPTKENSTARPLKIAILLNEQVDRSLVFIVQVHFDLTNAGHAAFFTEKSLMDLDMDVSKVRRFVEKTRADAWVVVAGPRDVLAWFSSCGIPAFALAGRFGGLSIAASKPNKIPALVEATRRLIDLGHRRIVLLVGRDRRQPEPGRAETAFLMELENHGIPSGTYNLSDWRPNKEGFQNLLESLFQVTPPTAVIADQLLPYITTRHFLAHRRLRVPEDVSILLCTNNDPTKTGPKKGAKKKK